MFDLCDVWGTSNLVEVFGGGPEEAEDFSEVKAGSMPGSMTGEELAGLCF